MTTTFLTDDELKQHIQDTLGDDADQVYIMDGYPAAAIGLNHDGEHPRVVYSYARVIDCLMKETDMDHESAVEFYEFNIVRSLPYLGAKAPLILHEFTPDLR